MFESENKYVPESNLFLDSMMETPQAAQWLKMEPRRLLEGSKGRRAKIPGFWINQRVVRYNPRTIIAKLAHDAGLPPEVVRAKTRLEDGGKSTRRDGAKLSNRWEYWGKYRILSL